MEFSHHKNTRELFAPETHIICLRQVPTVVSYTHTYSQIDCRKIDMTNMIIFECTYLEK